MKIGKHQIGDEFPTYFIADIAANHDGDLDRAKKLIHLAAENGANAAKFQHFEAETIVSDYGFKDLGTKQSHQSKWEKSVFEVYKDASLDLSWTPILKAECDKAGIDFFTSPYSYELVDHVDEYVPAYKIGSGDITWHGIIEYIAKKNKPLILASGASTLEEVESAISKARILNRDIALLQCNTNYTANSSNFSYISLNVLKSYKLHFPDIIIGLSDHTPGHATVLGSIALGARIIEKHFTDDNLREGPDHLFSMNPNSWREMIKHSRELELALGNSIKKIENNEKETTVLQRRSIRTVKDLKENEKISYQNISFLRPCPLDAIKPYEVDKIIGRKINKFLPAGKHLSWKDII